MNINIDFEDQVASPGKKRLGEIIRYGGAMSSKAQSKRIQLKLSPDRKSSKVKRMNSFASVESMGNFEHQLQDAAPLRRKLKEKSHS